MDYFTLVILCMKITEIIEVNGSDRGLPTRLFFRKSLKKILKKSEV